MYTHTHTHTHAHAHAHTHTRTHAHTRTHTHTHTHAHTHIHTRAPLPHCVQSPLSGDPGATLQSLGLCSGDLLWVLPGGSGNGPLPSPTSAPSPAAQKACTSAWDDAPATMMEVDNPDRAVRSRKLFSASVVSCAHLLMGTHTSRHIHACYICTNRGHAAPTPFQLPVIPSTCLIQCLIPLVPSI